MQMKKLVLYTLLVTALTVFGAVATQGDRIDADFSNAADADAFVAAAQGSGQGKGAQVTHNEDGTTSVALPEVATEMMAETAMDAIAEHANAVVIDTCPCSFTEAADAVRASRLGFTLQGFDDPDGSTSCQFLPLVDVLAAPECFVPGGGLAPCCNVSERTDLPGVEDELIVPITEAELDSCRSEIRSIPECATLF